MRDPHILFFQANSYAKLLFLLVILASLAGCATTGKNNNTNRIDQTNNYKSGFALSQQKSPPHDIQSILLAPEGNPSGAPIISLSSSEKLVLSFDYLDEQSRQFRVQLSHRKQDWEESAIPPSTYLDSFSYSYIQSAQSSISDKPSYQHVEYSFPNNQLKPAVSGNYFIEIYDYNSGKLLFSMPFFVTEDEGSLNTEVERLYATSESGRPLHQLIGIYDYPSFVAFPQFDLSMSFVQNRFWGRMRQPEFLSTITPGQLRGRLSREQAYIGNFEFKTLNLLTFTADGNQIIEYQPGSTPPKIILRRDNQNLGASPKYFPPSNLGQPRSDRNSNYARVQFSLETSSGISPTDEIYIVGHFNNWMINELNKMSYNYERDLWTGSALVKQGRYAYKYVLVRNNKINDLALDQGFLSSQQEYLNFVYFKDPDNNFDRLLKVNRIIRD